MKKLTILLTMLMATSAWAEVVDEKAKGVLLVCEQGKSSLSYNYKARKFTIQKLLQDKVKLPKEKKLIKLIKGSGADNVIRHLELNGLDVIYIDSTKDADIDKEAGISISTIRGSKEISSFYPNDRTLPWNVKTSAYEKIYTPGSCDQDYWYSKHTMEQIGTYVPWYQRSFPSDKDRWETLSRKSLVYRDTNGCYRNGRPYVYTERVSQCYVADDNKVIEINNALYKLKSIIKTYADEIAEDREEKRKERLKDNKI